MTGLRLIDGISLQTIAQFGSEFSDHFLKNAEPYIEKGWIVNQGDNFTINTSARIFADRIASDCFLVD